jgi:hypothetical protein
MARTLSRVLLPTATMLVMVFAGCLEDPTALLDSKEAQSALGPLAGFSFAGSSCVEGGFQAIYPGQKTYADVWKSADVQKEYGSMDVGATSANVHQGFKCKTVNYNGEKINDFVFGYVGDPIVAPSWDPGGADWQVLLSFVSLPNGTAYDGLDIVTTARISRAYESTVQYLAGSTSTPKFAAYVVFKTVDNGIYESYSDMDKYRDVAPRTIRLWWTVPADGSESHLGAHNGEDSTDAHTEGLLWNPVYFDIKTTGGAEWATPRDGTGVQVACHAGIDDHGPQGRLCQPTHTAIYEHKSLEFQYGVVLKDVVLKKTWFH